MLYSENSMYGVDCREIEGRLVESWGLWRGNCISWRSRISGPSLWSVLSPIATWVTRKLEREAHDQHRMESRRKTNSKQDVITFLWKLEKLLKNLIWAGILTRRLMWIYHELTGLMTNSFKLLIGMYWKEMQLTRRLHRKIYFRINKNFFLVFKINNKIELHKWH